MIIDRTGDVMKEKINPNFILSGLIGGTISAAIISGALILGMGISESNIPDTIQTQNLQTKNTHLSKKNIENSYLRTHKIKKDQNLHRYNKANKHKVMKQESVRKKNLKNTNMLRNNNIAKNKMNRVIISSQNTMNQKMEKLLATNAITSDEYNELNTIITPQNRETFIALLHEYLEDNKSELSRNDSLKENKQTTKKKFRSNNMRNQKLPPR